MTPSEERSIYYNTIQFDRRGTKAQKAEEDYPKQSSKSVKTVNSEIQVI